ncbi:ER membrane glycoprotein subunit of the GPI transamidase complex-like protein [Coemansia guatemalensis]|uniref:GPI mannosyltransferase 2 n=1 Tax=Coemansia guatemalensis TaxID=2761395 RepID=A0A9W8HWP0_9FUNG|nr:ER membrane glycoprotein subunit of the GPI transamidase complex-like protein [Coemansia guatemalensis]
MPNTTPTRRSTAGVRSRRWALVRYAALSRVASLALGVVANLVVDDYDASAQLVLGSGGLLPVQAVRLLARIVMRWDAFYFVHIADVGYVYEQEHAFFPLLPMLMRLVTSTVLAPLVGLVGRQATLVLAGAAISSACFVLATTTLYDLGRATLHNERMAYVAALLFVWAPSNMFMSAVYTESLFAWLVFTALLHIARHQHFRASLWLCASSLCRSNGVAYAGFIVWDLLVRREAWGDTACGRRTLMRVARAAIAVAVSVLGFVAFQIYGHRTHCLQTLHPDTGLRPYCGGFPATVYGFVQDAYWDVGFLRYYTWQQLPNFVLAAPMIVLSAAGVATYAAHDLVRISTLGWKRRSRSRAALPAESTAFFGDGMLAHVYLWGLLLAVATAAMHVQVITRFFSGVPAVFWFAAHAVADGGRWQRRAVAGYFAAYGLAGVVLFSNFFPPA